MLVPHPLIWIACEFSCLLGRVIDQGGISVGSSPVVGAASSTAGLVVGAGGAPPASLPEAASPLACLHFPPVFPSPMALASISQSLCLEPCFPCAITAN